MWPRGIPRDILYASQFGHSWSEWPESGDSSAVGWFVEDDDQCRGQHDRLCPSIEQDRVEGFLLLRMEAGGGDLVGRKLAFDRAFPVLADDYPVSDAVAQLSGRANYLDAHFVGSVLCFLAYRKYGWIGAGVWR